MKDIDIFLINFLIASHWEQCAGVGCGLAGMAYARTYDMAWHMTYVALKMCTVPHNTFAH